MDDDDDAWSYSFPPSTETLPIPVDQKKPLGHTNGTEQENEDAQGTKNSNDSDSGSSFEEKKKLPALFTGSQSSSLSSLALQSPFMVKSSPADPFTTRQDASSEISNESANALFERRDAKGDALKREALEKSMAQNKARNSLDDNSSIASSSVTTSPPMSTTSPNFITYRKSRRTTSEGNFQSILDAVSAKPKFNSKIYVDEFLPDTIYRYATIKRNTDFHQLFPSIDLTDRLLDDYACALSREILLQGRIYVSEHHVCFNSNLLGWVTNLIIEQKDIISFEKKSTAGLFPNGIAIETKDAKHYFASFSSRDSTYEFLRTVWLKDTGKHADLVTNDNDLQNGNLNHPPSLIEASDAEEFDSESPSKFQSYILSIDGDDEKIEEEGDEPKGEAVAANEEVTKVKVRKFKSDSKYRNNGPEVHAATYPDFDKIRESTETELCQETINAPLGVVFDVAFGSSNTDFHRKFLKSHDASEISEYGEFQPTEDDAEKSERHYIYRKALGYSIGPKSTMCEVCEIIETMDLGDYVSVLCRTVTPDVPLGNSFSVLTRYVFSWGEKNTTSVSISFYIAWSGRSWIKSVIEKQSMATQITTTADYISALRQEVEEQTVEAEEEATTAEIVPTPVEPEVTVAKPEPVVHAPVVADLKLLVLDNIVVLLSGIVFILLVIIVMQIVILMRLNETKRLATAQILATAGSGSWKPQASSSLWEWLEKQYGKPWNPEQKVNYLMSEMSKLTK